MWSEIQAALLSSTAPTELHSSKWGPLFLITTEASMAWQGTYSAHSWVQRWLHGGDKELNGLKKGFRFLNWIMAKKGRIPELRAGPGLGRADRTGLWGGGDS